MSQGPSVDEFRMPLLEHIRELRTRLVVSVIAIVIGTGISLCFAEELFLLLSGPLEEALGQQGGGLARLKLFEGITTWLRVGLLGGLLLSSPVVIYQIWLFIAPGLYNRERRAVLPLGLVSTALFLAGAYFGYAVIFRYGFPFFLSIFGEQAEATLSIADYLSTATRMLLAFGVCFQLPVIVFFLARIGLVNARDLITGLRYAVVVIFFIAALITPPDPLTQSLMAAPLTLLYIISIGVAKIFSTKDAA